MTVRFGGANNDVQGTGFPPMGPDPRRKANTRMLTAKIVFLLMFAGVAVRLVQIQIIDARKYQADARRIHEATEVLLAQRGVISDRNGHPLVTNSRHITFGADPTMMTEKNTVATLFARVFDKPRAQYLGKLGQSDTRFVYLERRVLPSYARRINAGEYEGLRMFDEPRRLYHYDRVAAQIVGFTDVDNKGLSGIELRLDSLLRGINGSVVMQRDMYRGRRPSVDIPRQDPVNGCSVTLTIDVEFQAIVEEELRKGVEHSKARGGLGIVLDPSSGEVLAMASYPSIDPADPSTINPGDSRIRAITDMFEPGSTFKIVTASAALESGAVKPDQRFNAEQGSYRVYLPNGKYRNTITDTHKHSSLSLQEAVEYSSNIVMAKVSDLVGAERLYTTARAFGFGTETGIDLPGEVGGELKRPTQWSGTTLNAMAYGYEVGATPIQIACAYAAIANGGTLMKPYVVSKIEDARGNPVYEGKPEVVRTNVVSAATASTITRFLRGVVERGTGMTAAVRGVDVAGKTGTARKYENGKYIEGSYIASFVGFFPVDNPAVVCLVMIDEPVDHGYTGSLASAPIFRAIAEKLYATSGRFRRATLVAAGVSVPDVRSLRVDAARSVLAANGLEAQCDGDGNTVLRQSPAAGARAKKGETITLTTTNPVVPAKGFVLVPDVRGMAIRRAVNRLSLERLDVAISGTGVVVGQSPAAGNQVSTGTRVALRCEAKPSSTL
jgi:cell division protein FtsI (penicillin-binding protein 3)